MIVIIYIIIIIVPSHHTTIWANSLELYKGRYDIVITDEEWYILVEVHGTPSGGGSGM